MPAWPGSPDLPDFPEFAGASGEGKVLTQRTVVSVGPDKVRKRVSDNSERWQLQITTDETGLAAFKTFFEDDCAGGATVFTWYHPEDADHSGSDAIEFSFVHYRYRSIARPGMWRINFTVEILP